MELFARLKIAHKLLISSAVLALPIVVLLYSVVSEYNAGIQSTQKEIEGTRRLEPLQRMAEDVRIHQRLGYLRLKGDMRGDVRRNEAARRIEAALASEFAPQAAARWRQLRSHPPATQAESTVVHQQLAADVLALQRQIGDSSMLVLDPKLDSYYLVELAVVLLPQAQETVADAAMLASEAALEQEISQRDLQRFAVYAEALENSTLPRVRHAVETSLREDRAFHGSSKSLQQNLPGQLSRYQAELANCAGEMRRYSLMLDPNLTASQIVTLADRAAQAGSDFLSASTTELRVLLERRISDLRWKRAATLLAGLLALALAAMIIHVIARNITEPLEQVVKLAADIAGGRVKEAKERLQGVEVRGLLASPGARDEICLLVRAIGEMTGSLDSLLVQVSAAGKQVAGSAAQMVAAVRQLEATVAEQASFVNQVGATSKEIFATVQELARTMAEVSGVAREAAESAAAGVGTLENIHTTMRSLMDAGAGLADILGAVAGRARSVDEVITTITRIANRTNLLSLNAAIEAESAGDSAGGFSVVALEIRRLADQTAVAALDIEKLVQEMQSAVREGVSGVEHYAAETHASSSAVDALSEGLESVIANTRKLGPEFENVNQGMQMQSQAAGQIAESMLHLRDDARQTRDSLEEFQKVAEQLRSAVDVLQSEVGRFTTAGG